MHSQFIIRQNKCAMMSSETSAIYVIQWKYQTHFMPHIFNVRTCSCSLLHLYTASVAVMISTKKQRGVCVCYTQSDTWKAFANIMWSLLEPSDKIRLLWSASFSRPYMNSPTYNKTTQDKETVIHKISNTHVTISPSDALMSLSIQIYQ